MHPFVVFDLMSASSDVSLSVVSALMKALSDEPSPLSTLMTATADAPILGLCGNVVYAYIHMMRLALGRERTVIWQSVHGKNNWETTLSHVGLVMFRGGA